MSDEKNDNSQTVDITLTIKFTATVNPIKCAMGDTSPEKKAEQATNAAPSSAIPAEARNTFEAYFNPPPSVATEEDDDEIEPALYEQAFKELEASLAGSGKTFSETTASFAASGQAIIGAYDRAHNNYKLKR